MDNQQNEKSNITPAPPNKRLQQTQAKVDEVVDIMRINVDKVLERDKNLSKLDNRADALQAGASQFEASAGKLKRKFWWRNCKILLALAIMLTILIIVTITWIVSSHKNAKIIEELNASHAMNETLASNTMNSVLNNTIKSNQTTLNNAGSSNASAASSVPLVSTTERNLEVLPDT